jgi:hypothetical protein
MRRVRSLYRPAATWAAPAPSTRFGEVPSVWPPGLMVAGIALVALWFLASN